MLIELPGHRCEDLNAWREASRHDLVHAATLGFLEMVRQAESEIIRFCREQAYASISWGKDSTILAHLAWSLVQRGLLDSIPLVHVRIEPIANPHCALVRNEFLRRWEGLEYHEIEVWYEYGPNGRWTNTNRAWERGFSDVATEFGERYITGICGHESGVRRRRVARGLSTSRACAPMGHWRPEDVWAYLALHDLPIHPAYAMNFGGSLDRNRLRVDVITEEYGSEFGRTEWERAYYPEFFDRCGLDKPQAIG